MRRYDLTVNDKSFSISVKSFSRERAELEINGTLYQVRIDDIVSDGDPVFHPPAGHVVRALDRTTAPPPASAPAAPAADASTLTAPIPGQILEIFVKEGSSVSAGAPVLKMEAMKMENVISAHASGIVGRIHVRPGDTVNQGQELLTIG